jgi:hypothetical protein
MVELSNNQWKLILLLEIVINELPKYKTHLSKDIYTQVVYTGVSVKNSRITLNFKSTFLPVSFTIDAGSYQVDFFRYLKGQSTKISNTTNVIFNQ